MAIHADSISFNAVGVSVTSGAASAATALPVTAGGALPKAVRVQATGFVNIKFGAAGVVATTNDCMISANEAPTIIVAGAGYFAVLQANGPQTVNVQPLEA